MMYFYDPLAGRKRRGRLAAQLGRSGNALGQAAVAVRDEAGRLAAPGSLAAQVQSRLARALQAPHEITVDVQSGRVTLRGRVFAHELDPLFEAVRSVPGVREVHERLILHSVFDSDGQAPEPWSAGLRTLTAAAGILLLVIWLGWQGFVTAVLGFIGAGLLIRAVTNKELKRVFGIGRPGPKQHDAQQPTAAARLVPKID